MTLQLQALLGIALFIAVVLPMSSNWRRINWKLVVIAVLLQFVMCGRACICCFHPSVLSISKIREAF